MGRRDRWRLPDRLANRKLKPREVDNLVARYRAGASIRSIGTMFGLNEQTVRAHGTGIQPGQYLDRGISDPPRDGRVPLHPSHHRRSGQRQHHRHRMSPPRSDRPSDTP